jgi:glucosamine kinase
MKQEQLLIGIDGGGTKCKAVLMDENNTILGIGNSGTGNPTYGLEEAQKSIVESATLALRDAKEKNKELDKVILKDIVAGIGLAGVNVPHMYELMTKWNSPFKSKYITTDLYIACLGAHGGKDGAVMVSGTGSCGFSIVNGVSKIIGAHGFPQGDQASGAWFGLRAVQAALLCLDKMGPCTTITHYVFETLKVNTAIGIIEKTAFKPASTFAMLANAVFKAAEEKDKIAQSIINEAVTYISEMARQLNHISVPKITFIGGMSNFLIPFLDDDIQKQLSPPMFPPEVGAVIYARKQLEAFY